MIWIILLVIMFGIGIFLLLRHAPKAAVKRCKFPSWNRSDKCDFCDRQRPCEFQEVK